MKIAKKHWALVIKLFLRIVPHQNMCDRYLVVTGNFSAFNIYRFEHRYNNRSTPFRRSHSCSAVHKQNGARPFVRCLDLHYISYYEKPMFQNTYSI